jgi:integrase
MKKIRESKGGGFESRGNFFARVVVAPQDRQAVLCPWATSLEESSARGRDLQVLVNRLRREGQFDFIEKLVELGGAADEEKMAALTRAVDGILAGVLKKAPAPDGGPLTFRKFAEQWTSGVLHKKYPDHVRIKRSSRGDVSRLEAHVYPVIGDKILTRITLDDALEVMHKLSSDLSSASRRHVAQVMSRAFGLAVYPCRFLTSSPLPRGFLPASSSTKAKSALYPDEEARLISCTDPRVTLDHRVLYGFMAREGCRKSEALNLVWSDLDLKRGVIRLDHNKTDDPRAWALDPSTLEALVAWRKLRGNPSDDESVFGHILDAGHLASAFREHLKIAGVTRAELFEESDVRQPIRLHDLRATFITVSLAAGKTEAWCSARTGHRSSAQISGYRRLAQTFADVGATGFVSMAAAVPELNVVEKEVVATLVVAAASPVANPAARVLGLLKRRFVKHRKCTGRDLNPYVFRRWNLNR